MKFYTILIRLSGSLHNEVWKHDISAAEVILLNEIHGGTAVTQLRATGEKTFDGTDHRRLRAVLGDKYGAKPNTKVAMDSLFGAARSLPLPEEVTLADLAPRSEDTDLLESGPRSEAPAPAATAEEDRKAKFTPSEEAEAAKEAVRESIRKLGGTVPPKNAGLAKLREALAETQMALAPKRDEDALQSIME